MSSPQLMKRSRILGVGSYVPPRVWKNEDLREMMDTSDEWIRQRTGIEQRHWVDIDSETGSSDLALEATKIALARAKVSASELDMIILATLSPDHDFPGTACFLQAKLGLSEIPALDVRQQCTGFIYGLSIADQFIRTGMYKKILVVGA
jgi:3-oxoacyl-[acyl-carrier-protein] synthase-3